MVKNKEFCRELVRTTILQEFNEHSLYLPFYVKTLVEQIRKDYPEYNITEDFIRDLEIAACVHDIGKREIPRDILMKPAKLTEEQFALVKQHCWNGVSILETMFNEEELSDDELELLEFCKRVCLYHHERNDGSGYMSLTADDIPIEAQIMAIIDSYDAMTCPRCYKQSMSKEEALESILQDTDKYNPMFLQSFQKAIKPQLSSGVLS